MSVRAMNATFAIRTGLTLLTALGAGLAPVPIHAQNAPPRGRRPSSSQTLRPVSAYVGIKEQQHTVTFVDRTREGVVLVLGSSPHGTRQTVGLSQIESVYFDLSKIPPGELHQAVRGQQWVQVVRLLSPVLGPTLPYLDLANNNAVEPALMMGDAMMRAAKQNWAAAQTEKARAAAAEQYKKAYTVLRYVGRAEWSSAGQVAELKSLQCLMALDRKKTARKLFEEANEPVPGDRVYGLYWLIKAHLDVDREDFRAAMDAAVKSVAFENKDIDTFPDALMVTARCYEEFQSWYRARDVYYEIARIFPKTDWARTARRRLRFIVAQEHTKEEEKSEFQNVFFGRKEDVNKLVQELLEKPEDDEPVAESLPETEDEPVEDADLKVFDE
jgi:hypothetical protein